MLPDWPHTCTQHLATDPGPRWGFVSFKEIWEGMSHLLALTYGASTCYWATGDPWDHWLCPIVTWEHHKMFCLEIKGPTPWSSFLEPSSLSWHIEDSCWPCNGPLHHYFVIAASLGRLISHIWVIWWACYQSYYYFSHYNIIRGLTSPIRINRTSKGSYK